MVAGSGAAGAAAGGPGDRLRLGGLRGEVMPAVQDGLLTERGETFPVRGVSPETERHAVSWPVNWSQGPIKMSSGWIVNYERVKN